MRRSLGPLFSEAHCKLVAQRGSCTHGRIHPGYHGAAPHVDGPVIDEAFGAPQFWGRMARGAASRVISVLAGTMCGSGWTLKRSTASACRNRDPLIWEKWNDNEDASRNDL